MNLGLESVAVVVEELEEERSSEWSSGHSRLRVWTLHNLCSYPFFRTELVPLGSKLLIPFCSQASSKQYKAVLLPEKLVLSNQLGTNSIFSLTVRIRKVCERVSLTRELDCQSLHSDDWRKTRRRMLSAFLFRLKSGRQVTYSPSGTTSIFDPRF